VTSDLVYAVFSAARFPGRGVGSSTGKVRVWQLQSSAYNGLHFLWFILQVEKIQSVMG